VILKKQRDGWIGFPGHQNRDFSCQRARSMRTVMSSGLEANFRMHPSVSTPPVTLLKISSLPFGIIWEWREMSLSRRLVMGQITVQW
jgi:hypothetical protein